eukprot:XP_003247984.3 PREDICTED: uncharacterized protein LOC100571853 [Acyrthosiphon pisum]
MLIPRKKDVVSDHQDSQIVQQQHEIQQEDTVAVLDYRTSEKNWSIGTVTKNVGKQAFEVDTEAGTWKRHIDQIIKIPNRDSGVLEVEFSENPSDPRGGLYSGPREKLPVSRMLTGGIPPLSAFCLYPIFAESYEEYSARIMEKCLHPMKLEAFNLYQSYYPNLCEQYTEFVNTMEIFSKKTTKYEKLISELNSSYSETIYDRLKAAFPKPFESQVGFDNRLKEDGFHLIYNRFFAKRMYPKMSETYEEYKNRINSICLRPISNNMFVEYKKNYPQLQYSYTEINFEKKENKSNIDQRNLAEIQMDISEFNMLIKRLPNVYENYQVYRQRMSMIETDGIDEEEVDDLKKVYIRQCEKYEDYTKRMDQIDINPTSAEIADKLKMTVPREYETHGDSQYYHFLKSDYYDKEKKCFIYGCKNRNLTFFLDENGKREGESYKECMYDFHYIKAFSYPSYKAFKYVLPRPFEKYTSYKMRIEQFQKDYDFSDYEELENYAKETFKSFIQPLTKDEFLDLKLRFPKLSETPKEYGYRLDNYSLDIAINNHLFHLIKHSQIQLYDDYESYEKRFKKLVINRRKFLEEFGISLLSETQFKLFKQYLPTKPYVIDYSAYTIDKMKIQGDTDSK